MIKREELIDFALTLPKTSYDNPFDGDFDSTVLRHSDTKNGLGLFLRLPAAGWESTATVIPIFSTLNAIRCFRILFLKISAE